MSADKSLPLLSGREVVGALLRLGCRPSKAKQKGNDHTFVRDMPDGSKRITVVPIAAKEIPKGTLKKILNLAEISVAEFKKAL